MLIYKAICSIVHEIFNTKRFVKEMKVVNLNPKGKIEKQKNYVYQLIIFTTKKKKRLQ